MPYEFVLLLIATTIATACFTWIVRRLAKSRGVMDVPNWRSSHVLPTPRGGGIAIVVGVLMAMPAAILAGIEIPIRVVVVLSVLGGVVALIGFVDDRRHVPASVRFAVQVAAIGAALVLLPGVRHGIDALPGPLPTWATVGLVALASTWFLNLFNFMDGIDGIAASQAIFMSLAAASLMAWGAAPVHIVGLWLIVAAATTGFLVYNWAPASIFMGDTGSGFLGFLIAVLLVYSIALDAIGVWTAITLGAAFITDASVTLLRRVMRGEQWYTAHRSHGYQWLARRWRSHALVTTMFLVINVLVVLPVAWWTMRVPVHAAPTSLGLLTLLSVAWTFVGSGRPDPVVADRTQKII